MVTDTAMVRREGKVYAFGPVVRELEVFHTLFGAIEWIGFDRPDLLNDPVMLPVPDYVQCILLKRSGGDSFLKKIGVLLQSPVMTWEILKRLRGKRVIHTRAPSSPAFIGAILSFFFSKKIWWHKYAGNWGEVKPPFFYGLQRWWLSKAVWSKVTINGRWPGQPAHCLSFENPCVDEDERQEGIKALNKKCYEGALKVCFVGHLSEAKGADMLLEALIQYKGARIESLHLIGDGPLRQQWQQKMEFLPFEVHLHGYLARVQVGQIMAQCHLIILPSKSEGFPKVIAEGANYGCIPVVSDISSIGQYIRHGENGFLLSPDRLEQGKLAEDLEHILKMRNLKPIALAAHSMAAAFTFEHYLDKIKQEILIPAGMRTR